MTALQRQGALAKEASRVLATAGTQKKNEALEAIARILTERQDQWLSANAEDLDELTLQMKVRNLPTILFIKNGEVIKRVAGMMTKDGLIDLINQLA